MEFLKSATVTVTFFFDGDGVTEDMVIEELRNIKRSIEENADPIMSISDDLQVFLHSTQTR